MNKASTTAQVLPFSPHPSQRASLDFISQDHHYFSQPFSQSPHGCTAEVDKTLLTTCGRGGMT